MGVGFCQCLCARPPKPNKLPLGDDYRRYQMSHTHPEGCAPVDHHTAVAFEVPASLLLSPTLEADSEIYVTLLLTWPDITPSKFIHSSGLNLNRELLRFDVHRASLDRTTACFHWGAEYLASSLYLRAIVYAPYVREGERCLHTVCSAFLPSLLEDMGHRV